MKNFDRVRAFAESQFKKQEKQFSLKIGATINQCSRRSFATVGGLAAAGHRRLDLVGGALKPKPLPCS